MVTNIQTKKFLPVFTRAGVLLTHNEGNAGPAPRRKIKKDCQIGAMIENRVMVTVARDYGTDHAALTKGHLETLAGANIFLSVLPLVNPVSM